MEVGGSGKGDGIALALAAEAKPVQHDEEDLSWVGSSAAWRARLYFEYGSPLKIVSER